MNNDFLLNSISFDNIPTLIGYITSGIFIIIGILLIIQNNFHKKALKENSNIKTNNIDKLINKDKIEKEKSFNPDSIFKKLPNFSNKNFFNKLENDLKNKLNINDLELIKKEIIDFKEDQDKYIILSSLKTKEKTYIVTSEKSKNNNKLITNCPICGGKIKDITLLRCKHCDSILPQNKDISPNEWTITDIK